MEIRDLVDKNRLKTGETVQKGEEIPEGRYIQSVFICIQNEKEEYLVQKRSKEKNGKYAFISGHILTRENSLYAILREIKEEIGLELTKNEIKLILSKRLEHNFVDIYYTKKEVDLINLSLQKEEVELVKWMKKEEIEKLYKQGEFLEKHIVSMTQCMEYIENENER